MHLQQSQYQYADFIRQEMYVNIIALIPKGIDFSWIFCNRNYQKFENL